MSENKTKKISLVLVTTNFFLLTSCANLTANDSRSLRFKDSVIVTTLEGRETPYKAGESVGMPQDPVFVESPGQVSVLVVPIKASSGINEVKMRKLEGWTGPEFNREVNQRLNKVIERVVDAQKALSKRQGQDALRIIDEVQTKYPELTYLDFLKASAHVLNGNRELARSTVDSALNSFPSNVSGQALKNSLDKGDRR